VLSKMKIYTFFQKNAWKNARKELRLLNHSPPMKYVPILLSPELIHRHHQLPVVQLRDLLKTVGTSLPLLDRYYVKKFVGYGYFHRFPIYSFRNQIEFLIVFHKCTKNDPMQIEMLGNHFLPIHR